MKTQVFNICGIRPKTGIFRNAVKTFLAVYAGKLTDSLNPKKFNCVGHICAKVKTPYGQKRGGGIWRRTGGEPSGARAPPKGRAKRRPQPRPSFSHKPPHFHLVPFTALSVHPAAPFFAHRFCDPAANRAERERRRKGAQSAAPHRQPPHFHLVPFSAPGVHPAAPLFAHRFCVPPGAPFLKGRHKFAIWNDTIALRLKKRRAQIGWRSKKRLCYALFCPSAFL